MLINKLTSVFHASVQYIYFFITLSKYLWIDEAIAVWIDNVMTKFIVNNRTGARKTDVNLFFYNNYLSNCPLSIVDASHKL